MKGGPGAAVEPTVCNRKVPGSSPSLCTFVRVRLGAITTLPQTPHSAGSLRHWVRPLVSFICTDSTELIISATKDGRFSLTSQAFSTISCIIAVLRNIVSIFGTSG